MSRIAHCVLSLCKEQGVSFVAIRHSLTSKLRHSFTRLAVGTRTIKTVDMDNTRCLWITGTSGCLPAVG